MEAWLPDNPARVSVGELPESVEKRAQWAPRMPRELAGSKAKLKTGALLVNAGRGAVIDTHALITELEAGRLEAALDVTDPEPPSPDSPLWSLPNVLLTPHVAGDSPDADQRIYELVGDQIRRYVEGRPLLNVVR